jgi:hypothetical protein
MHEDAADLTWLQAIGAEREDQRLWGIQGPLLDRILGHRGAVDHGDPYTLVEASIDFANWATQQAFLVAGEFPQQSMWSCYVDY